MSSEQSKLGARSFTPRSGILLLLVTTLVFWYTFPVLVQVPGTIEALRALVVNSDRAHLTAPLGVCGQADGTMQFRSTGAADGISLPGPKEPSYVQFAILALADRCQQAQDLLLSSEPTGWQSRPSSWYLLGVCWHSAGNDTAARQSWARAEAGPHFIAVGNRCGDTGNAALQRAYYEAAADSMPLRDRRGYMRLLEYFADHGPLERIQPMLEGLLRSVEAGDWEALYASARALAAQGESQQALMLFDQVLQLDPKHLNAYLWGGVTAQGLGDAERARDYYQRGLRVFPGEQSLLIYMGLSYEQQGKLEEAFTWYQRAGTSNSWPLTKMAQVRFRQQRYEEALAYYLQAMPLDGRAYVRLGAAEAALELGRLSQARPLLQELVQIEPNNIAYRLLLASTCGDLGDRDCAIAQYQQVLRLQPEQAEAQEGLEALQGVPSSP